MFVTFQLVLVLVYALCFQRLESLSAPISQLNTAQHIVYRASRTRFFAVNLVFSTTAAEKAKWRVRHAVRGMKSAQADEAAIDMKYQFIYVDFC
jgi:hypothetical protein